MKNVFTIILVLISMGLYSQTLEEYFKLAAENNPGLLSQYKEFEAVLQKVPQVSTLPDPSLSFGYFVSPVETRVGPQKARFSLTQMFPWFGTLKAQGDAAALMAEAKYQSFLDAKNKLYYEVSAAYFPLYELQEWMKIEERNIEILESYKTISNSKFKNGVGTLVDVLRVDIFLKESQTNLEILKKKERPLLTTFNKLLNRGEFEPVSISETLEIDMLSFDNGKDSLLVDHPLLNSLELKVKAVEASERAAIKQGFPKIGLGLDYVMVDKRTDMVVPDNGKDVLMPMVTLSLPIFRKKYKAAVKEAQLMQESYSLQKTEMTNSLLSNYEMAFFDIEQQTELVSLFDEQITESEQALNLLFTSYGNSGKDFEEVLRMQQQLLKYDKLKITALKQYKIALAKLNYITAKK
ncbi:MAG TPA: TolC family protein [Muricauda sp.]|uniref:TolC family protein n=1 Tax=Maribacter sp. UBA3344 TaxID=1946803 RepID=UPI000E98F87A|nr:TolC family protein [Maribacter sp. UBA3344]HAF77727.1 TolC family protein [Maribacter sp.]HAI43066.1 TolC family protein [Maribacter sp.]HBU79475.1 TolC family protein [Allomuricauda sp.]